MPFPTLNPALARALDARGYSEPTSVQAEVLAAPVDRDLLVSAQTGSGKTVAFGLAFAPTLLSEEDRLPPAGPPLALIIAPTRELALQVHARAAVALCRGRRAGRRLRRRHGCAAGAPRLLSQGAHIVVGTPGRLQRPSRARRSSTSRPSASSCSTRRTRCSTWASARSWSSSLTRRPASGAPCCSRRRSRATIATLAKRYQRDALRIDDRRSQPARISDIEYRAMRVVPIEIERAVVNMLRLISRPRSAMMFCATRDSVRHLQPSADRARLRRRRAVRRAVASTSATRRCRRCATAARGSASRPTSRRAGSTCRISAWSSMPICRRNAETLLHRSGRTGRAGARASPCCWCRILAAAKPSCC